MIRYLPENAAIRSYIGKKPGRVMGPKQKPHILLLIDDEHRADVLPVEGNSVIRTPTLNRLIERGTYFRNAYTPSPVCVPARQCLLSGRYLNNNGCRGMSLPLPSEVDTIPGHLSRYGYRAVGAGKMHFANGTDQMHGFHERIGRDIRGRNGYEPVEDPAHGASIVVEQGTGKRSQIAEMTKACTGLSSYMRQDAYTVDGALMYLDEYFVDPTYDRIGSGPLFLAVSLNSPHYPFQCPEELFNYYLRRVEPRVEELPKKFECNDYFKVRVGVDVSYREAHRATAAYYGMIEWADAQFGRVISKLEELNVLDDFVVVFLSDHGEMLGEKGLWEKQQYFDASVRVPFFISEPRRFPKRRPTVQHNVSLVDLFPTLCDIADVPIPDGLDGRSLVPLMEGNSNGWSNEVYSELHHPENGPSVMVKQDNLKYFRFNGRTWPEQLFDLEVDPKEEQNLIDDPAYAEDLARLRAKIGVYWPRN